MVTTSFNRMRKIFTGTALVGIVLFLCLMVVGLSAAYAQEKAILPEANLNPLIPISQGPVRQINPYFSTQTIIYSDGTSVERSIINGPPTPPPGYELERTPVALPEPNPEMGTNSLTVPAFDWVFGCSSVSGAMIAGYYDRNGYPNMYTGPTNGGVMPLDNSSWPTWSDGSSTYPNLPLAASHNGVDGRATRGSIDDYWFQYLSTQDPYVTNGWTQHPWGEAIGDYMKTSHYATYGNTDGATTFWNYPSASQLTCSDMESSGFNTNDGTYGRKLFYEARGYTVTDCYSQLTDNVYSGGFSFAQYKAEIDAGRPVMLNLVGHTVVGVGYTDWENTVYIHDTWDYSTHTMTWGGSYSYMELRSVSIVNLVPAAVTPPTVTTGSATNVTSHSATLNGTVNANSASTTVTFQYGLTTSYGSTVTADQSPVTGSSNTSVSKAITGLTSNTTYHYRVAGVNSGGTSNGSDMTFKTSGIAMPWLLLLLGN